MGISTNGFSGRRQPGAKQVMSARARRRKRRARNWAIVRGVVTFVTALSVLLVSEWLAGDLALSAPRHADTALAARAGG